MATLFGAADLVAGVRDEMRYTRADFVITAWATVGLGRARPGDRRNDVLAVVRRRAALDTAQ